MPVETKTRPNVKVFTITDLKLLDEEAGTFEAAFANLRAIDNDGDGYDDGAIGEQRVMVSQWNHGSWGEGADALPIGVGKTFERDGWGMISGEFDMSDPDAQKTYRKLKYLREKGFPVEWSFALPETEWRMESRDGVQVRIYTKIKIPEVSPVLMGAGIDTHLTDIKSKTVADVEEKEYNMKVKQFAVHLDEAVEAVESVIGRAKEIRNLREEKGKEPLSRRNERRLKALRDALEEAKQDVDALLIDPNDEFRKLASEYAGGKQ